MTNTVPERFLVWRAGAVPVVEMTFEDEALAMAKAEQLVRDMPLAGPVAVMRLVARVVPGREWRGPPVVQRTEER